MPNETTLSLAHPAKDLEIVTNAIREGRFQRSLALLTAGTSIVSGLEVAYEHYRGSYSRRVMYTPVILSVLLGYRWHCGLLQPPCRTHRAAAGVVRYAGRCVDRLLLSCARHQAEAGRLAAAHDEHDHGVRQSLHRCSSARALTSA